MQNTTIIIYNTRPVASCTHQQTLITRKIGQREHEREFIKYMCTAVNLTEAFLDFLFLATGVPTTKHCMFCQIDLIIQVWLEGGISAAETTEQRGSLLSVIAHSLISAYDIAK